MICNINDSYCLSHIHIEITSFVGLLLVSLAVNHTIFLLTGGILVDTSLGVTTGLATAG